MKKNKLRIFASAALIGIAGLSLTGCKKETTPTETPVESTTTEEETIAVTKITATGAQTEFTAGDSWSTGSLVVKATMADGTEKTVTSTVVVDHSAVNLEAAGTYTVTLTYGGQTTTYTVTVKAAPTPTDLILVTSSAKTEFLVGEAFDSTGLSVKVIDSEYNETAATSFTTKIYKESACTTLVEDLSTEGTGTYYVQVTVGELTKTYTITVDTPKYTLIRNIVPTTSASVTYTADENDFYSDDDGNKLSILAAEGEKGTVVLEKNEVTVDGVKWPGRLNLKGKAIIEPGQTALTVDNGEVTNNRVLKLVLAHDSDVKLIARSSNADEKDMILTDLENVNEKITANGTASSKTMSLKAGTYYIYCEDSGMYLYGISISRKVEQSSISYESFTVDSTDLPETYSINETIDLSKLVVEGLNNYGVYDVLTDFTVTKEDGSELTSFDTAGNYKIKVKVGTLEAQEVTIHVKNPEAETDTIIVKEAADKLIFKQGEAFDITGLVLTEKDKDGINSTISDLTEVTSKVLEQGTTTEVTDFSTATRGHYDVEITYGGATVKYDIVVLEKGEAIWTVPTRVYANATAIESKLTIPYVDGTEDDIDYTKFYDTYESTVNGYSTEIYTTQACDGTSISLATALENVGSTYYAKYTYGEYSKTQSFEVVEEVLTETYLVKDKQTLSQSFNNALIFDGSLLKLSSFGKVEVVSEAAISAIGITLKLNKYEDNNKRGLEILAKVNCTVTFYANATGNSKKYSVINVTDSNTEIKNGTVSKNESVNTEIVVELLAGKTYQLYSVDGIRIAGYKADVKN